MPSLSKGFISQQQWWVFQRPAPLSYHPRSLKKASDCSCHPASSGRQRRVTTSPQLLRFVAPAPPLSAPRSILAGRKLPQSFPSQEISCGEALSKQRKSSLVQKKSAEAHSCKKRTPNAEAAWARALATDLNLKHHFSGLFYGAFSSKTKDWIQMEGI